MYEDLIKYLENIIENISKHQWSNFIQENKKEIIINNSKITGFENYVLGDIKNVSAENEREIVAYLGMEKTVKYCTELILLLIALQKNIGSEFEIKARIKETLTDFRNNSESNKSLISIITRIFSRCDLN